MITQYIRDGKGHKRGVLAADINSNTGDVTIGWSLCNKKDEFDKVRGKSIAIGRAQNNNRSIYINEVLVHSIVPDEIKKDILNGFADRVIRYFHLNDGSSMRIV